MSKQHSSSKDTRRTVSIADVAALAGCAPATVSRRLNTPDSVGQKTVDAIDKAIAELGYVRNASARALRASRSHLVGAIVPTLRHSIYAEMLEGLQRTLADNGFSLIHNTSDYDLEEEYRQALTLVERGVEAVVLVGTRHKAKTFELLSARGVTCVTTYALQEGFKFTSVGFDNRRAAAIAAEKFYALGHRRFAMIAGITHNNDRARARIEGFVEALIARGVSRDDIAIAEAPYTIEEGQRATGRFVDEGTPFTALFCGSDILAVGALRALKDRGVKVPGDVSLIGFDNLEISAFTDPALSTLNVPAFSMGEETANHIVRTTPGKPAVRRVELEVSYVERGSVGPVPTKPRSASRTRGDAPVTARG